MNYLKFMLLFVLGGILVACGGEKTQDANTGTSAGETVAAKNTKIEVIDFHSTHRCMTCNAIESNTKYTLETYFADELRNGTIEFLVVNVDEEENAAMAEKFEAAGTALFLNCIKKGEETHIDLTDFAFMKGTEQEIFSQELKVTLDNELKKL